MKERLAQALALLAELNAGQRITPDGQQTAQQLGVLLQQAHDQAEEPPVVQPVDAALAHLTERVEALCEAAGV
ncbi:hypothetical protein FSC37_09225 [Piscinibacter aquaticus]|uniref:Uncharacterized protein n=1 Tax=Piscinibacter aquaticus TaxID=392597 RepID=A0A5C6U0G9_9BURK|nr:hypothetical protein FSC37_09225 [Piscinibacter aquaticus]